MLGLKTTITKNIERCLSEFVYETTLCLLGELFASSKSALTDLANYVQRLKKRMNDLKVTLTRLTTMSISTAATG